MDELYGRCLAAVDVCGGGTAATPTRKKRHMLGGLPCSNPHAFMVSHIKSHMQKHGDQAKWAPAG